MEITFRTNHQADIDRETTLVPKNDLLTIWIRTVGGDDVDVICAEFDKQELKDLIGALLHVQSRMNKGGRS